MRFSRILLVGGLLFSTIQGKAQQTISLAGKWHVKLDSQDLGITQQWYNQKFENTILLPGTLDDARIGTKTNLSADKLEKKVYSVPEEIDKEIARIKLEAMGVKIDTLTDEQLHYLSSWEEGT